MIGNLARRSGQTKNEAAQGYFQDAWIKAATMTKDKLVGVI
jgi:hypothetical protein